MRQRVGLARAMAADPEILLMDEPFSTLEPLIRRQLQDQFLELAKVVRKTTIFITHDLDEAIRLGDHIAIMKDGRIVQIGTPEDIVPEPADAYVADFVAGFSRLGLVTAGRIMLPLDAARDLGAPRGSPPTPPSMRCSTSLPRPTIRSWSPTVPARSAGSRGAPCSGASRAKDAAA